MGPTPIEYIFLVLLGIIERHGWHAIMVQVAYLPSIEGGFCLQFPIVLNRFFDIWKEDSESLTFFAEF